MSREFKFRVWDINKKYYLTQDDEYHFYETDRIGEWQCPVALDWCLKDTKNYVVQQYTGLNDKNNKEIYEGDIIKGYGFDRKVAFENAEVIFYGASFVLKKKDWETHPSVGGYAIPLEVIGNIFENPELLK